MFNSDEEAHEEVRRGRAWGSIIFQSNYSESLVERTEGGRYATDYTIEASDVDVRLDMSSNIDRIDRTICQSIKAIYFFKFQINKLELFYIVIFNIPTLTSLTKF